MHKALQALEVRGLRKSYPTRVVFNNYTQTFDAERICLVGGNGAGKSTLLASIAGAIAVDAGEFIWQQQPVVQRQQLAALASDSIAVPDFLTPRQLFTLNQKLWRLPWPENHIQKFAVHQYLDKTLKTLSAGNQKKTHLICAFMRNTPLLLLDEPNLALDQPSLTVLWQLIEQFTGHIILASNEPTVYEAKGFKLVELD